MQPDPALSKLQTEGISRLKSYCTSEYKVFLPTKPTAVLGNLRLNKLLMWLNFFRQG